MGKMEWTHELAMGLPAMDADHRRLLALANRFQEAADTAQPLPRLAYIVGELIARARLHFEAEESLLDRVAFPGLAAHRAEHQRLLGETQHLYDQLMDPAFIPSGEGNAASAAYLLNRLVEHVLGEDHRFRSFVMRLA